MKRIYFADIQTSDLLYYDPDFNQACFRFCQERDIDCLPALNDPKKFFRKTETGFVEEMIKEEMRVDGEKNIFDSSMLEQFRGNHILFVYTNDELTGVVHFSDYNKPVVDEYLFRTLSSYERSLRKLLALHGLKNQDMLAYLRKKLSKEKNEKERIRYSNRLEEYEISLARNDKLPEFANFYLLDLICLAGHHKKITLSQESNELRKMIMHAHDLVSKDDAQRDDYIYNFESFKKFFEQVTTLLQDHKKVSNKVTLMPLLKDNL